MATSAANTVVGSSNGLQINLIWDASVKNNANWAAIEASVISAASAFTNVFSSKVTANITVELDQISGKAIDVSNAAQSSSSTVVFSKSAVVSALAQHDTFLGDPSTITANLMANNSPSSAIHVTTAQAKALGLIDSSTLITGYTGIDGHIGIRSNNFYAVGGTDLPSKYDATSSAAHEISEVLGRISTIGNATVVGAGFTTLDLFRYSANGVRSLAPADGAYFSIDNGKTALAPFNNPSKGGGDAGDWAYVSKSYDSFNAFGTPGQLAHISPTDFLALEALGYQVNTVGIPKADVILA